MSLPVPVASSVTRVTRLQQPPRAGAGRRAVLLPGAASDEVFVRSAFAAALDDAGIVLHAPAPRPGPGVVDGYRAALDDAARRPGPLLVGGISLGAQVALAWAAAHPARVDGLLLALPAWTGSPAGAPAALAARATAAAVRVRGTAGALAAATVGAPPWLAAELARAWPRYGAGLAPALEAAAAEPGPDPAALHGLRAAAGVVGAVDDPVHPVAVARRWAALLPRAELGVLDLAAVGADPPALGAAAVAAWQRAARGTAR